MDLDQRLHHGDLLIQSHGLGLLAKKLFTVLPEKHCPAPGAFRFYGYLTNFLDFPWPQETVLPKLSP